MKTQMSKTQRFQNQNGSLLVILAFSTSIIMFLAYAAGAYFSNSMKEADYSLKVESRQTVLDRFRKMLQNDFIINYTLQNCSSPAKNNNLKKCILTGTPNVSHDCDNVEVDFCEPGSGNTYEVFSGTPSQPIYVDASGKKCDINIPNNVCLFKLTTSCNFTCPGTQSDCGMVKVMSCNVAVEYYSGSDFSLLRLATKSSAYIQSYSIRISNDLTSFSSTK